MSGMKVGVHLPSTHCKQALFATARPQRSRRFSVARAQLTATDPSTRQSSSSSTNDHVAPAVLPGTTQNFKIPEKELIDICKKYAFSMKPVGAEDDSVLAPDFKFEFPAVKLERKRYLEAVRSFDFLAGIPNVNNNAYDFRVDKYEPQRVWYTVRVSGTHTGTLKFFGKEVKPTGRDVLGCPECISMTFNEDGKVTSFTGGYVMDNRLGTSNKLGGLFGILNSMGIFVPFPQSGTLGWKVGSAVDSGVHILRKVLEFVTLGLVKNDQKDATSGS